MEATATRAGCDRVPWPESVPVHNDSFVGIECTRHLAASGGLAFGDSYRCLPGNIPEEGGNAAGGITLCTQQSPKTSLHVQPSVPSSGAYSPPLLGTPHDVAVLARLFPEVLRCLCLPQEGAETADAMIQTCA